MTTTNGDATPDNLTLVPEPIGPIPRNVALMLLGQIYEQLPSVACKGLCHDSCTVVDASQLERDILAVHDITLSDKPPALVIEQARANPDGKIGETCPALNPFGKCTVYRDRPVICRTFGVVSHPLKTGPDRFEQGMMCDHGCEPEWTLSMEEFMEILSQVEILSRVVTGIARMPVRGDSRRLMGMFRRDKFTERAGFEVARDDVKRHVSESDPAATTRAKLKRSAAAIPGVDPEELALLLDSDMGAAALGADPVRRPRPVRKSKRKGKKGKR